MEVVAGGLYLNEVQAFLMDPFFFTVLGAGGAAMRRAAHLAARVIFVAGGLPVARVLPVAGVLLTAWTLLPGTARAQDAPPDSLRSVTLQEVEITAERGPKSLSRTRLQASDVRMSAFRDAADALATGLGVRMRRYGPTGLATLSIRGADAAHTAILLGGMPLVHPQTGSMDLSLIPTGLVADALLQSGPSEAAPAMGGSVELGTPGSATPSSAARGPAVAGGRPLAIYTRAGSWGERAVGMDVTEDLGRARLRFVGDVSHMDGSFPFENRFLEGAPSTRREGAARTWGSGALVLSSAARAPVGAGARWEVTALGSRSDRGLPGPSNAVVAAASQQDNLVRLQARVAGGRSWTASGAVTEWDLDFEPGSGAALGVEASRLRARTGAVQLSSLFRSHSARSEVRPSLRAEYTDAAGHQEWTAEPGVATTLRGRRASLDIFSRLVASSRGPAWPTAGATWSAPLTMPLAGRLELETGLARTVRLPAVGERYHVPGGNPDLRAERGLTAHLSVGTRTPVGLLRVTAFGARLDDRILWRPLFAGPGLQVFHPENVGRVQSMGLEWALDGEAQWARASVMWRARGSRVRAEDISDARAPGFGHQLRYTPVTTAMGEVRVAVGGVSGGVTSRWEGRRFITSDESSWLGAFQVLEADLRASYDLLGSRMSLWLRIHNITDTAYESMRLYPMPPRHIQVGIHIRKNNP